MNINPLIMNSIREKTYDEKYREYLAKHKEAVGDKFPPSPDLPDPKKAPSYIKFLNYR